MCGSFLDPCLMIFYISCITFSSMNFVSLFIDFESNVGLMLDVCMMNFLFALGPCETFKFACVSNDVAWSYHSENVSCFSSFFSTSLGIDFDLFGHRCWIYFGIPLASNSMFCCARSIDHHGDLNFIDFDRKMLP